MSPGDKILVPRDLEHVQPIPEYTVKRVVGDTVYCEGEGNAFYVAFTWPARARKELEQIIQTRAELRKKLDDSMGLVYELKNKIQRGEL